jgi:hypothetical protein
MTSNTNRRILTGFCMILTVLVLFVVTAAAQTSVTKRIQGAATSTTKQENGTVVYVEGNTVVLKMSTGEVRTVTVPDTRTAVVDGKEITVRDLKVGTTLTVTITTTTTPAVDRTNASVTGKVWHVQGRSVILTLPDGTNKMYQADSDMKFDVGGREATYFDLRKGMQVTANKIVEAPVTEVASNTVITGHAPTPRPVVAQVPAPIKRAAAAPAPARAPAPEPAVASEPAPVQAAAAPAKLPKSGSPLPLVGMLGLLFTGAGLGLRKFRRS